MGWAAITPKGCKAGQLEAANDPRHIRLYMLARALEKVFEKIKPDVVVIEKAYVGKDPTVAIALGQAQNVPMMLAAAYKCDVEYIESSSAKKNLTGKGNAKKHEVQLFAARIGKFTRSLKEHEADAFAVAFWYDSTEGGEHAQSLR